MGQILYDFDRIDDEYMFRLCEEHIRLDQLCQVNSSILSYKIVRSSKEYPSPPIHYKIRYNLRSIIGVDKNSMPRIGNEHELEIRLPITFPEQPADCKMLTDCWHPNIKYSGPFKGTICTNHEDFGTLFFLDELVVRIGELIQYKRYFADDIPPFPEDPKVAKWIRNFAEPGSIVNRNKGISIDNYSWIRDYGVDKDESIDINIVEIKNSDNSLKTDSTDSKIESKNSSDISFTER